MSRHAARWAEGTADHVPGARLPGQRARGGTWLRLSMMAVVASAVRLAVRPPVRPAGGRIVRLPGCRRRPTGSGPSRSQAPRGRILDRNGKVLVDNRVAVVVAIDRNAFGDLTKPAQATLLQRLTCRVDRRRPRHQPRGDHPAARRPALQPLRAGAGGHRRSRGAQDLPRRARRPSTPPWWSSAPPSATIPTARSRPTSSGTWARSTTTSSRTSKRPVTPPSRTRSTTTSVRPASSAPTSRSCGARPGLRRIEVDAEGDPVRVISERAAAAGRRPGAVHRRRLQALAEQKVQQGLADARARPPRNGNPPTTPPPVPAVVEDPNNGQLLALASYPTYDPNAFVDGIDASRVGLPQRPGQRPAVQQLGDPGPVGAGLDLQAVRGLRRPDGRRDGARHRVPRLAAAT